MVSWIGQRIGCTSVTSYAGTRHFSRGKAIYYECVCDCGRRFEAQISNLRRAKDPCGCTNPDRSYAGKAGTCHPLYKIWSAMIERCTSPGNQSYKNYGARGITVCERWLKGDGVQGGLDCFLYDMGDKPEATSTIERRDNDKGYSPDNCCWASRLTQARNRRTLHIISYDGRSMPLFAWCEELQLPYFTIARRLNHLGWSPERALTEPIRTRSCR